MVYPVSIDDKGKEKGFKGVAIKGTQEKNGLLSRKKLNAVQSNQLDFQCMKFQLTTKMAFGTPCFFLTFHIMYLSSTLA